MENSSQNSPAAGGFTPQPRGGGPSGRGWTTGFTRGWVVFAEKHGEFAGAAALHVAEPEGGFEEADQLGDIGDTEIDVIELRHFAISIGQWPEVRPEQHLAVRRMKKEVERSTLCSTTRQVEQRTHTLPSIAGGLPHEGSQRLQEALQHGGLTKPANAYFGYLVDWVCGVGIHVFSCWVGQNSACAAWGLCPPVHALKKRVDGVSELEKSGSMLANLARKFFGKFTGFWFANKFFLAGHFV
jgi:hypothetical protein